MAEWVYIKDVADYEGKEIEIKGWLYGKRSSGKIQFYLVRDGSGLIQAVGVKNELPEEVFNLFEEITQESSIIVTGIPRADSRASGGYELTLKNIKPVQKAPDYPITRKEHGTEFLMDNRHLWLRSSRQYAIMKIRATLIKAIRDFLDNNGFILIDAPILTPSACEGTTTLFATDYFGQKAYLTQSGQLYNEAAAMAFGKVYCFGPTFRAEKSKTRRHLMEFWMVEPEMAYYDLEDNLKVQEEMISYLVAEVLAKHREDLKLLKRDTAPLEKIKPPFPRVSYDECVRRLNEGGINFEWGGDFGSPDETFLAEKFEKPFFVHRFPTAIKAFYMKPDPDRPEVALCADLLAPEGYGEIIGGGQRADDPDYLKEQIKIHNLPEEAYQWYLDLRKFGSVPHGGFGLGVERAVAWICKLDHVRETIPFARTLYRIYP